MRTRLPTLLLLLALFAATPGCALYYGIGKMTGLMAPKKFSTRSQTPPEDFRLGIKVRDLIEPPTDFELVFQRTGRATYDVVVRLPKRKQLAGAFEITEDQVVGLWRVVAEAKFDEMDERYPSSGEGKDPKQGTQTYYVFADGTDHRVESVFQAVPELEKIRNAILNLVPKEIMTASGAPGFVTEGPREYLGDSATRLFHLPGCPRMKDVPPERRKVYPTSFQALDYGFQPCPECQPDRPK